MALPSRVRQLFYKVLGQGRGEELCDLLDAYFLGGGTVASAITFSENVTVADAKNVVVGSSTGTKIGTATTQKIGLWNVTPVVQPASASQAVVGAVTTVGSNTGTAGAGLSLIGDTTSVNQAGNLMNDLVALQEDIAAVQVLVNRLRTDLIAVGIIKGSA